MDNAESPGPLTVAPEQAGRYHFIDAIRGLAALLVIYQHVTATFFPLTHPAERALIVITTYHLGFGKVAVAIFFMVSGYVVPFSLKGRRGPGLARFVISRFFRLYPLYWVSLLLALAVTAWLHDALPFPPPVVALNLTMLQQFFHRPNVLGVYWTLQIELIFYVLCAAMFALGWLHRRSALIVAAVSMLLCTVAMAAARYHTARKLPVALPLALTLMFIGTLWKRYQLNNDRAAGRAVAFLVGSFVLLLPAITLLAYNRDMGFGERWYAYLNCYLLSLAVFFAMTTFARVNARWAVFLGDISYSIYLLHELVMRPYMQVASRLPVMPAMVHVVLVGLLTVALCTLTRRYIELPAIALGKRLSRRIHERANA